jgi:hypothetical protein
VSERCRQGHKKAETQNQNLEPLSARDVKQKNYGRLKKKERRTVKKEESRGEEGEEREKLSKKEEPGF